MRVIPPVLVFLLFADPSASDPMATYSSSCFMEAHFTFMHTCWHQVHRPQHWIQVGMERGFLKGESRFWPGDVEWTREAFAYAISETGGNIVDNGLEFGCCGIEWTGARDAGYRWKLPMPKSERTFKRKLRDDPEFCAFMTCATLAYFAACCDGDIPYAVAGLKFGQGAFQRLSRTRGMEHIYDWPYVTPKGQVEYPMRHWRAIVRWTRCVEAGRPCYECEPAMERDMKGGR